MIFKICPFINREAYCEYWFISPFCENGDLRGALQLDISGEEPKLEVEHRIKILFQIEKALEYLHTPVKGVRYEYFTAFCHLLTLDFKAHLSLYLVRRIYVICVYTTSAFFIPCRVARKGLYYSLCLSVSNYHFYNPDKQSLWGYTGINW
jgi:hypothetical protein